MPSAYSEPHVTCFRKQTGIPLSLYYRFIAFFKSWKYDGLISNRVAA
jgi:hypothetical protein